MPRLHSDHSRLTGSEREQFVHLLLDAFSLDAFDSMLANKLSRDRETLALGRNKEVVVERVVDEAEMNSWTAELLAGARAARPTHAGLFCFAQQFSLAPSTAESERLIRPASGPFNPLPWLSRFIPLLGQVCRIEVKGASLRGTGFLVAPDIVLTNYHVVEPVINWQRSQAGEQVAGARIPARLLSARFDHKVLADDTRLSPGTCYALHDSEWLVDWSPPGEITFEGVRDDELDYALLRLATAPGNDIVDAAAVPAAKRGWVTSPAVAPALTPGTPLFILGHPLGESLKVSLDTNAVITVNANQTRVRYATNTEAGSSGSPCFDRDWNLVALHHAGDTSANPRYNEGIPVSALCRLWLERLSSGIMQPWQKSVLEQLLPS